MKSSDRSILNLTLLFGLVFLLGLASPEEGRHAPGNSQGGVRSDLRGSKKGSNQDAHYLDVPTAEVLALLDDPKGRVSDSFAIPPALRPMVGFWFLIYTKYSAYHTVFYDRTNHERIYEVIDTRDIFERGLGPIAMELTTKKRVNSVLNDYRAAIQKLAVNPRAKFKPGSRGARLVEAWGLRKPAEWRRISRDIRYQVGQRDRVMLGLNSADRFIPAMEAIFRKSNIPPEITRIPLVESSFHLRAHSKANAVGVWQFLERSASEYLVVDKVNKIDERISPIKSTYAAAKMFRRNFKLLGDWGLAIIAYNHGQKNLLPIRRKYGGANIAKLLTAAKGKSPLGYASTAYYSEFLAMLHVERYRDRLFGMDFDSYSDSISIVKMKRPASVFELALLYNVSIHELQVFNPDIFDLRRTLPAGTRIVLPRKLGESLVAAPQIDQTNPAMVVPGSDGRSPASPIELVDYLQ